jgi:hypothetical protein
MRITFQERYLTKQEEQKFKKRMPDLSKDLGGVDVPTGIIPRDPTTSLKYGLHGDYFYLEALVPLNVFEEIRNRAMVRYAPNSNLSVTPEDIFSREFLLAYWKDGWAEQRVSEKVCQWAEQNNSLFLNGCFPTELKGGFHYQLGGNLFTVSPPNEGLEYSVRKTEMQIVVPISSGRMIFDPEKPRVYLADKYDRGTDRKQIRGAIDAFLKKYLGCEVVFPEGSYYPEEPSRFGSTTILCDGSLEIALRKEFGLKDELADHIRFPNLQAVMPCRYGLVGYATKEDLDGFLRGLERREEISTAEQHKQWRAKSGPWILDRIRDFFRADPSRMILLAKDLIAEDSLPWTEASDLESLLNITRSLTYGCSQTCYDNCKPEHVDAHLKGYFASGLSRVKYSLLQLSSGILIPDHDERRVIVKEIEDNDRAHIGLKPELRFESVKSFIQRYLPDYNVQSARGYYNPKNKEGK